MQDGGNRVSAGGLDVGEDGRADRGGEGHGATMGALSARPSTGPRSGERPVARPGFSGGMAPPAALCIHLCIGQAYAFSVFNLPMTKLIGISQSAADDWKLTDL